MKLPKSHEPATTPYKLLRRDPSIYTRDNLSKPKRLNKKEFIPDDRLSERRENWKEVHPIEDIADEERGTASVKKGTAFPFQDELNMTKSHKPKTTPIKLLQEKTSKDNRDNISESIRLSQDGLLPERMKQPRKNELGPSANKEETGEPSKETLEYAPKIKTTSKEHTIGDFLFEDIINDASDRQSAIPEDEGMFHSIKDGADKKEGTPSKKKGATFPLHAGMKVAESHQPSTTPEKLLREQPSRDDRDATYTPKRPSEHKLLRDGLKQPENSKLVSSADKEERVPFMETLKDAPRRERQSERNASRDSLRGNEIDDASDRQIARPGDVEKFNSVKDEADEIRRIPSVNKGTASPLNDELVVAEVQKPSISPEKLLLTQPSMENQVDIAKPEHLSEESLLRDVLEQPQEDKLGPIVKRQEVGELSIETLEDAPKRKTPIEGKNSIDILLGNGFGAANGRQNARPRVEANNKSETPSDAAFPLHDELNVAKSYKPSTTHDKLLRRQPSIDNRDNMLEPERLSKKDLRPGGLKHPQKKKLGTSADREERVEPHTGVSGYALKRQTPSKAKTPLRAGMGAASDRQTARLGHAKKVRSIKDKEDEKREISSKEKGAAFPLHDEVKMARSHKPNMTSEKLSLRQPSMDKRNDTSKIKSLSMKDLRPGGLKHPQKKKLGTSADREEVSGYAPKRKMPGYGVDATSDRQFARLGVKEMVHPIKGTADKKPKTASLYDELKVDKSRELSHTPEELLQDDTSKPKRLGENELRLGGNKRPQKIEHDREERAEHFMETSENAPKSKRPRKGETSKDSRFGNGMDPTDDRQIARPGYVEKSHTVKDGADEIRRTPSKMRGAASPLHDELRLLRPHEPSISPGKKPSIDDRDSSSTDREEIGDPSMVTLDNEIKMKRRSADETSKDSLLGNGIDTARPGHVEKIYPAEDEANDTLFPLHDQQKMPRSYKASTTPDKFLLRPPRMENRADTSQPKRQINNDLVPDFGPGDAKEESEESSEETSANVSRRKRPSRGETSRDSLFETKVDLVRDGVDEKGKTPSEKKGAASPLQDGISVARLHKPSRILEKLPLGQPIIDNRDDTAILERLSEKYFIPDVMREPRKNKLGTSDYEEDRRKTSIETPENGPKRKRKIE
ncbi:hypothetical protein Ciccas_006416, partial [Cichlidogyrus casuarinus]